MTVLETLTAFGPEVLTCRLVRAVLAVVPEAPGFPHYGSIADVASVVAPTASAATIEAAVAQADSDAVDDVLWMSELLDAADRGRARPFAPDDPDAQADDAVLKALALGWMAFRVADGDVPARVDRFLETPSGRVISVVWAAMEVVLPLGGAELDDVFRERGPQQANRLAAMAGEHSIEGAQPGLVALAGPLQRVVDHVQPYASTLTEAAAPFVPGLIGVRAGAEEEVAKRVDRMPLYSLLGARVAAEHAVRLAAQ